MRTPVSILLPLVVGLAGCSGPEVNAPSLAPRPAEAIDPRVPVAEAPVPTAPSPELAQKLDSLVAQALAGDEAFRPAAADAERLAAAAGPPQSESWVAAQNALSVAVAARQPVTHALGEIVALGADRIQKLGGMTAADLAAVDSASARVGEIDDREAGVIDRIQARLGG
jgi:hypothetical protein